MYQKQALSILQSMEPLVSVIVALLIVGFIVWLISFTPIDPRFKQIIQGILIFAVIIWLILTFLPMLSVHPHPLVR